MGLGLLSKSSYDTPIRKEQEVYTDLEKAPGNPDPTRFIILNELPVGDYLIVHIKYPGVTNFEGSKVLVYEDLTIKELRSFRTIDPHFSDSTKFKSPIARFLPTNRGWDMARKFCLTMIEQE